MSKQPAVKPASAPQFAPLRFDIEKGVPIPPRRGNGIASKFPFAEMKPGDSFFAKGVKAGALSSAATGWKTRHQPKWKFCTRTVEGGSHIWRLE